MMRVLRTMSPPLLRVLLSRPSPLKFSNYCASSRRQQFRADAHAVPSQDRRLGQTEPALTPNRRCCAAQQYQPGNVVYGSTASFPTQAAKSALPPIATVKSGLPGGREVSIRTVVGPNK